HCDPLFLLLSTPHPHPPRQLHSFPTRRSSDLPELLLMDEPFGALDEIVRDHLNEQLLQLWAKTNKTVIFVTHSIPEAVFLSTRIDRKSTRLNSSHLGISYAVFCLKKKIRNSKL